MDEIEHLKTLLKNLNRAAYLVLVESNGVSDNEWHTGKGVAIPRWPVKSFYDALKKLSKEHQIVANYFDPSKAEKDKKWRDACATASFVVEEYKKDPQAKEGSLHRNIADAIYGTLLQTSEERAEEIRPKTMNDVINGLVGEGKLVKFDVKPKK